jgi:hypothetical protein
MIAIKTRALGATVVAAVIGGIALSAALGLWKTANAKEPVKIKSGEFAGLPNPADIRGSYTWADVAKAFSIPEAGVVAAFGGSGADEKVNSLEARYAEKLPAGAEIGTDSVRLFAALYAGLPFEAAADTILPKEAIEVLRAGGRAESARIEAAAARALGAAPPTEAPKPAQQPSAAKAAPAPSPPAPSAAPQAAASPQAVGSEKPGSAATVEHAPAAGAVTGKTTFGDLKSWGFDMGKVSELLGGEGPAAQAVKDYCSAKGLSFSEVKVKIEALAPK